MAVSHLSPKVQISSSHQLNDGFLIEATEAIYTNILCFYSHNQLLLEEKAF